MKWKNKAFTPSQLPAITNPSKCVSWRRKNQLADILTLFFSSTLKQLLVRFINGLECASSNHQMELVKTELVSSQKGCYVKQHISKFGLIQKLDKMKYYKSPVCVYFTHVRHQMRKNCYVWDTKLIWADRRYVFSATNYYVGHKFGPRYIFSVPGGTDVLLWNGRAARTH